MSSTRSVKSPGVWAADATTTIPGSPLSGVAYRRTSVVSADAREGWPFDTLVDSAEFNELLYRYATLIDIMDRQGVLGWSDQVDYTTTALVFGSDGVLYKSLLASGPTTTARDPISNPTYWSAFNIAAASETVAGVLEIATAAEAQAFTANKAIDGAKLASAFQGSNQSKAANGYQKLPGGVIVQWGGSRPGDISGTDSGNITFPIAFPTACRRVIIGSYGEPPNVGQGLCALYGAPTTTSFGYTRTEINGNATPGAGFDWVAFGE